MIDWLKENTHRVISDATTGKYSIDLDPGESKEVSFEIDTEKLELINAQGERILEKGEFKITIAGASPSPRSIALGATQPVEAIFRIK